MHHSISLLLLSLTAPWPVISRSIVQQPLIQADANLQIPKLGLGLWNSKDEAATKAIGYAFEAGYEHFDGAAAYYNEEFVGKGFHAAGAPPRESYWVTSKLWNTMHKPENVPKALAKTLSDMDLEYLDLWLMHWPVAFLPNQPSGRTILDESTTIEATWKAMEKVVSKDPSKPEPGTARYIGISNFDPRQIDRILAVCTICPYAHEFETHPYLQQQEFVNWHAENNIIVISYSPLGNTNPTYNGKRPDVGKLLDDEYWAAVAAKKGVTPAQAILGWNMARGTVVIPKSTHQKYVVENLASTEVTFTAEELKEISARDLKARFNNPSSDWGVHLFEDLDDGTSRAGMEL